MAMAGSAKTIPFLKFADDDDVFPNAESLLTEANGDDQQPHIKLDSGFGSYLLQAGGAFLSPSSRRNSNHSARSIMEEEDEVLVFVDSPNKKLYCRLCDSVFKDPVIVSCGHTYCKSCVQAKSDGVCPVDEQRLVVMVANIAVSEQIGELMIHCKYGCCYDQALKKYVADPTRCPMKLRMSQRKDHESDCDFMPVECPNNAGCPQLLKKDLDDHLRSCNHVNCPYKKYSCDFIGTQEEMEEHLKSCRFEGMKDFIHRIDEKVADLQMHLNQKDQEIEFLRSMLGRLSERLENMEKNVEMRFCSFSELVDRNQNKIFDEILDNRKDISALSEEMSQISMRINLGATAGAYDPISMFKCKGTFVGHLGPVWCLCTMGDYLFSGSTDKTIKVWDTSSSYKCVKTMEGHTGIVLALCTYGNKLFSGSQDCNIISPLERVGEFSMLANPNLHTLELATSTPIHASQGAPPCSPADSRVPTTPNIERHNLSLDQSVPCTPSSATHQTCSQTAASPTLAPAASPTLPPTASPSLPPPSVQTTHVQPGVETPDLRIHLPPDTPSMTSDQLVPSTPSGPTCHDVAHVDTALPNSAGPTLQHPHVVSLREDQMKATSPRRKSLSRRRLSLDKVTCRAPVAPPPENTAHAVAQDQAVNAHRSDQLRRDEIRVQRLSVITQTVQASPPSGHVVPSHQLQLFSGDDIFC